MNHLPLIIKREYFTKVKNKSFIVMTFLSPIIMIILISVVAYLSQLNNDKQRTISILDASGLVKEAFQSSDHTNYHMFEDMTLTDAKAIVKETSNYGLLYIGKLDSISFIPSHIEFYSQESPSLSLISELEGILKNKLTDIRLEKEGFNIELKTKFSGPYEELYSFYSDIDLVVIASSADSGPSLYAESCLSSVPVISTKVGLPLMGIKHNVNGIFIDRKKESLKQAIIELYNDRLFLKGFSKRVKTDYLETLGNDKTVSNILKILKD